MLKNILLVMVSCFLISCYQTIKQTSKREMDWSTPDIPSLDILSIESLRNRTYQGKFELIKQIDNDSDDYKSYMASYNSDGLIVYARVDIPEQLNNDKPFPVLLYSHGWVGIKEAPNFNFFLDQKGSQAKYIDSFAKNGYIVITPGWRGHGTVDNKPAQGIEFMQTWDNSTYISPVFYAIDMLNALEGVTSLNAWPLNIKVDNSKIFLASHSQGGDSALITLAVTGEGSTVTQSIKGASFFAGCFLPRLQQGELYGSMAMTPQAFLAGDNTWTASAVGKNGKVNPNFNFAFPPDWINQTDMKKWTWQKEVWNVPSVKEAYIKKYEEMYNILLSKNLTHKSYRLTVDHKGRAHVLHPAAVEAAYANSSAINFPKWLTEPIILHHSDRDYYSPRFWNQRLENRLKAHNPHVIRKEYKGNTHSLTLSKNTWFSGPGTSPGLEQMITTDLAFFLN